MSAWTCRQTARPPERLLHPVFEPHHGRASGADSGEKHEPAGDIDTAVVASLEALDPGRPNREADIRDTHRHVRFGPRADSRTAANRTLFDDLVGALEERLGNCQTKCFGGLEIDDKLELGRLLNWNFGGFDPAQQFDQLPSKNVAKNRL